MELPIQPMLAHSVKTGELESLWNSTLHVTERKFDGHRAVLVVEEGEVHLFSRQGKDRIETVPFLHGLEEEVTGLILDGELIVPGGSSSDVNDLSKRDQLEYVAFDLLSFEGNPRFYESSYRNRRQKLEDLMALLVRPRFRMAEVTSDGRALFEEVKAEGCEGVMIKDWRAPYVPGKRTHHWKKLKVWNTFDVVVTSCDAEPTQWTVRPGQVGTDGVLYPKGKPSSTKLAGHVGLTYGWYMGGELRTVGSLGYTGPKAEVEPFVGKVAEVRGWGLYRTGAIRHPGVLRFRDDKLPEECVFTPEMATL